MSNPNRPAAAYLVGSGLLGFVLGAFVVASLGSGAVSAPRADKSASIRSAGGMDDAGGVPEIAPAAARPTPTTGSATPVPPVATTGGGGKPLADRQLEIPVQGVRPNQLVRSYHDARDGGGREHEALDILAARNTPVLAVEDGVVAKLFLSKAGGITIYQFDPEQEYCYYYAHLERYADGLKDGDHVKKGQVIGYVGTTGNASKETPHLHFAIFQLTPEKHWWQGTPLDPYDILAHQ